jgi:hypothetical protein
MYFVILFRLSTYMAGYEITILFFASFLISYHPFIQNHTVLATDEYINKLQVNEMNE